MEKQIVRDAVHIKLQVPIESPIISVYEFCYICGYGLNKMNASAEVIEEIRGITDFELLKKKIHETVGSSDVWESIPQGERLKSLILGCRLKNRQIDGQARELFEMGIKGS